MSLRSSDGNGVPRFRCPRNHVQIFWETVMAGSNGSLAADFIRQFDQVRDQAKSVFATQKELLDVLEQKNAHWFARTKSEAEFATTMANKLASARSMPDMTSLYQDWLSQRMQRYVEDSNHVLGDVQKFFQTSARMARTGNGGARLNGRLPAARS